MRFARRFTCVRCESGRCDLHSLLAAVISPDHCVSELFSRQVEAVRVIYVHSPLDFPGRGVVCAGLLDSGPRNLGLKYGVDALGVFCRRLVYHRQRAVSCAGVVKVNRGCVGYRIALPGLQSRQIGDGEMRFCICVSYVCIGHLLAVRSGDNNAVLVTFGAAIGQELVVNADGTVAAVFAANGNSVVNLSIISIRAILSGFGNGEVGFACVRDYGYGAAGDAEVYLIPYSDICQAHLSLELYTAGKRLAVCESLGKGYGYKPVCGYCVSTRRRIFAYLYGAVFLPGKLNAVRQLVIYHPVVCRNDVLFINIVIYSHTYCGAVGHAAAYNSRPFVT